MFKTITAPEKVMEDGVYDVDIEYYHTQNICPGPSISSTGIRKAVLGSPLAFWKTSDLNPNRYPKREEGDSLILGKAAHALILGDEVFDKKFIYVPKDAPGRPTPQQIAAFERDGEWSDKALPRAQFWEDFDKRAKGRLLLREEQVEKIMYMSENLAANQQAVEVLTSELIEKSMIWQDPVTGLWIKARPDNLPSNGYDFGDLKTFAPKIPVLELAAQRAVTDHGYHIQMALSTIGAEFTLGTTAKRCALVFIQTTEPYEVVPLDIDEDTLYWGRCLCRKGIDLIDRGLKTGEWPGRVTDFVHYSLPPYEADRLAQQQLDGTLPSVGW